jgi:MFS family permease
MKDGAGYEWRNYWTLAIAASLGNSITVLHIYSIGPFIAPLQEEFGWSRAQISFGLTVEAFLAAILGVGAGVLVDRWGPRRVGIIGVAFTCAAYAMLGTATGTVGNWLALWALVAVAASCVKPTVWAGAIASRFDASRGLALAVTISGSGVAGTIIPLLVTWIIAHFGWRSGFFGLGTLWALLLLPFLILFFRSELDGSGRRSVVKLGEASRQLPGLTLEQGLRSAAFYKLSIAGMAFAFVITALVVHFVPILQGIGLDRLAAASIAGLVGLSSIVGRLGTGVLIDRFRADRVATIVFLLPALAALLLLSSGGAVVFSIAALIVGLSMGAELDVIIYLSTRHLGLKRFGVLFAILLVGLSIGTGLGPIVAGAFFDQFGTYKQFLLLVFPLVIFGSLLMRTLGPYPDHEVAAKAAPT